MLWPLDKNRAMSLLEEHRDLWERAAPLCEECGKPIIRTEFLYVKQRDGNWIPIADIICPQGHRKAVQ